MLAWGARKGEGGAVPSDHVLFSALDVFFFFFKTSENWVGQGCNPNNLDEA